MEGGALVGLLVAPEGEGAFGGSGRLTMRWGLSKRVQMRLGGSWLGLGGADLPCGLVGLRFQSERRFIFDVDAGGGALVWAYGDSFGLATVQIAGTGSVAHGADYDLTVGFRVRYYSPWVFPLGLNVGFVTELGRSSALSVEAGLDLPIPLVLLPIFSLRLGLHFWV